MSLENYMPLIQETLYFFMSTMVELALLFIGISVVVGVLQDLMPQDKVKRWLSGRNGRGYVLGSVLGGLTPFCSCSTIPVTLGLLKAGAGFGPTMAFLFTSPLVNPIIIPLFISFLGIKITVLYIIVAVGMAILISYFLEKADFYRFVRQEMIGDSEVVQTSTSNMETEPVGCCETKPQPLIHLQPAMTYAAGGGEATDCCGFESAEPAFSKSSRWKRVAKEAVKQYRTMLPYIVIGVMIGSLIHGFLPTDLVAEYAGADNPLAIPVAAVIGAPLYIRVSTMIPIAVSLIAKGMSYGAVVALTIGGAGASLPEVAMLKGIFRAPLLAAFICSVLLVAVTAGFLMNAVM